MKPFNLYACSVGVSAIICLLLTPLIRALAVRLRWYDAPSSSVKTHKIPTPVLGGVALWASFSATLIAMRFLTSFPSGTLHSLRAMLAGAAVVFLVGIADDMRRPGGLDWKTKMAMQAVAAALLIGFGIRIKFISPAYVAVILTTVWVVGISNAFNIVDIMDGLAASQAAVASLAFLLIALPSEEVYVNLGASALLGSCLGFLPWNLSSKRKIFMGDSGSLFLGFVLSGIALGTDYSRLNTLGVYAPLFILLVPIFDTFFVAVMRIRKGHSPFLGSKDHFALRLEIMGYNRHQIVALCAAASGILALCAFLVTRVTLPWSLFIYVTVGFWAASLAWRIAQVDVR